MPLSPRGSEVEDGLWTTVKRSKQMQKLAGLILVLSLATYAHFAIYIPFANAGIQGVLNAVATEVETRVQAEDWFTQLLYGDTLAGSVSAIKRNPMDNFSYNAKRMLWPPFFKKAYQFGVWRVIYLPDFWLAQVAMTLAWYRLLKRTTAGQKEQLAQEARTLQLVTVRTGSQAAGWVRTKYAKH